MLMGVLMRTLICKYRVERDADETPDLQSTAWKTKQFEVLIDPLIGTLIVIFEKQYRVKNHQMAHQFRF